MALGIEMEPNDTPVRLAQGPKADRPLRFCTKVSGDRDPAAEIHQF